MTRQINILVVEDFGIIRKKEIQILKTLGFQNITEAENGKIAVEKLLENDNIDLILSDWNMPEMDGYDLLGWVRSSKQHQHIPFVMATAQAERVQAEKAYKAGVTSFISKPFSPDELQELISDIFDKKPDPLPLETTKRAIRSKPVLKVAHIQITDHLVLGVLDHMMQNQDFTPRYFELETRCFPSWNPVQKALEQGTVDAAFILAPIAMDLFASGVPIRLILFAHKNGSICVRNRLGDSSLSLREYLKNRIFYMPHILSVHHMLADMFLKEIGLTLGPVGNPAADVFYEVVAPVKMPEFLAENPDACGFVVAEPLGTKAISEGISDLLFLSGELWQNHPCCVVVMRQDYMDAHTDAVYEFADLLVKAGQYTNESPDLAAGIAAKFLDPPRSLGYTEPLLETILKDPMGVKTDDLFPVIEDLDKMQRYMHDKMHVGRIINLEKFVDLRFAQAARPPDNVTRPSELAGAAKILANIINREFSKPIAAWGPENASVFTVTHKDDALRLIISSNMQLVDRAIAETRVFLKIQGADHVSALITVMRELLINAVEHGSKNEIHKTITCDIIRLNKAIFKVTVKDEGEGFNPDILNLSLENTGQIRHRGYGMINAFSEKIEFNETGNQVTVYVRMKFETVFEVEDTGDFKIIRPSGDITASIAERFRELLKDLILKGFTRFRFDMQHVQDVDSVSLSVFIVLNKILNTQPSHELEMIHVRDDLINLFKMTHLDKAYKIEGVM